MGIFIMISLVLILILGFLYGRDWTTFWSEGNDFRLSTLVGFFDSFFNDVFFIGAAIFFLFQSERRVKRKSALKDLHSLRIIAHVIDMHQLTKNKQSLNTQRTFHSPKRDLNDHDLIRYLQYCIEMLSLTSKVAAAYANDFDDEVVLNAINEIEELTTGLSNKISQKIGMVD